MPPNPPLSNVFVGLAGSAAAGSAIRWGGIVVTHDACPVVHEFTLNGVRSSLVAGRKKWAVERSFLPACTSNLRRRASVNRPAAVAFSRM
ncbi:hypothetical protein H257_18391 [Aphanomyces astaci]|uniref:Uncharacterized protein n=1 Tax=Aphanomyces astaci TaxID=112090 RepID=W4FDI3_APHAT|nr:hypothetical protein H257_18391 [Aphanomyces astaci]ETV64783.1 hypothetical protein H257_18391 [Aphanomyces astaci]|eukprot:XP_009845734.1 hypothetical protein H257_18391 [Aphanomyces astaci]